MEKPPSKGLSDEEIVRRIKQALARDGTHTWEDVCAMLKAGIAQIFYSENGAWITQVIDHPRKSVLHVWVVAGELPEVMALQPQVVEFARSKGCEVITSTVRKGWLKEVAPANGWHEHAVLITHEV